MVATIFKIQTALCCFVYFSLFLKAYISLFYQAPSLSGPKEGRKLKKLRKSSCVFNPSIWESKVPGTYGLLTNITSLCLLPFLFSIFTFVRYYLLMIWCSYKLRRWRQTPALWPYTYPLALLRSELQWAWDPPTS